MQHKAGEDEHRIPDADGHLPHEAAEDPAAIHLASARDEEAEDRGHAAARLSRAPYSNVVAAPRSLDTLCRRLVVHVFQVAGRQHWMPRDRLFGGQSTQAASSMSRRILVCAPEQA